MKLIRIEPKSDDVPEFITEVQALTDGLLRAFAPPAIIIIKVDNFFGSNWLHFSGKALGALGVWKKRLNVPPFVPNRVVSQKAFRGPNYEEAVSTKPIHIHTESVKALLRYVADVARGDAIVWYSGRSVESSQGSMMAHFPTPEGYWPLYVRWVNRSGWRVVESHEITPDEIRKLTTNAPITDLRVVQPQRV
jgi:hypothetical protein